MVEWPPAIRKPDTRRTCHGAWTTRARLAACGLVAAAGCAAGPSVVPGHEPPDVVALDAPRTAFVQLFEWKWTDIARECETYLGPNGFAAVQISPPSEHAWYTTGDGAPYPWWMRYQPVSYSLDASRSGNRAQFVDMVNRCNAVGVGIYVDAVFNHMTSGSGTRSSAGNDPWGVESYPRVPYGPGDFHPTCTVNNYQDAGNVQTWSTSNPVPLAWISGQGTRGNWRATVTLPASTHVEYKYIKKDGASNVIWESGANRVLQTGAGGTSQTISDVWK